MTHTHRSRRARARAAGRCIAVYLFATMPVFIGVAHADPPSWLDRAIVRTATRRAVERAGLLDDPTRDIVTRARAAGLVPHVSFRVLRGFGSSATQSAQPVERSTYDDSWGMDVRVAFGLDRLVFDGVELAAARMRLDRFERRIALERDVVDALAALQRTSLAALAAPAGHPDHARAVLEVERSRAALEVLVGVNPDFLLGR